MTKLSKSPERNTFQKNNYIKRAIEKGKSMSTPREYEEFENARRVIRLREVDGYWEDIKGNTYRLVPINIGTDSEDDTRVPPPYTYY